jgi:hypothetical protein
MASEYVSDNFEAAITNLLAQWNSFEGNVVNYFAVLYLSEIKRFQENFEASWECSISVVDRPKNILEQSHRNGE